MSSEAIEALTASVSECSVRTVDLWTLVGNCSKLEDDYEAVRRLRPSLQECRMIVHQYHQVRGMITEALEQLGMDPGHCHGSDPVSSVLFQGSEFVGEFVRRPEMLLETVSIEDCVDGFMIYALAEYALARFGVEFLW